MKNVVGVSERERINQSESRVWGLNSRYHSISFFFNLNFTENSKMSGKKLKRSDGTPMEIKKAIAKHFQDKGQGSSDQE